MKRGRAAAPLPVSEEILILGEARAVGSSHDATAQTGRLGRRDGREAQTYGRPTGRPFFCL
jgi:hypothetical protein